MKKTRVIKSRATVPLTLNLTKILNISANSRVIEIAQQPYFVAFIVLKPSNNQYQKSYASVPLLIRELGGCVDVDTDTV